MPKPFFDDDSLYENIAPIDFPTEIKKYLSLNKVNDYMKSLYTKLDGISRKNEALNHSEKYDSRSLTPYLLEKFINESPLLALHLIEMYVPYIIKDNPGTQELKSYKDINTFYQFYFNARYNQLGIHPITFFQKKAPTQRERSRNLEEFAEEKISLLLFQAINCHELVRFHLKSNPKKFRHVLEHMKTGEVQQLYTSFSELFIQIRKSFLNKKQVDYKSSFKKSSLML